MKIQSEYPSMVRTALLIPADVNVKLIIRHSMRPRLKDCEYPDEVLLNTQGIEAAKKMGKGISYSIGNLYSSHIKRCQQTLQYIQEGAGIDKKIQVEQDILGEVFFNNKKDCDAFLRNHSLRETVYLLKNGIEIPGFVSIYNIVNRMLNFIFKDDSIPNTLDIYCTHDFHIALLLTTLFDDITTIEDIRMNWPEMLEGLFLYGTREDFYCLWRSKLKRIQSF